MQKYYLEAKNRLHFTILLALSSLNFFWRANLDPNPLHDGYMYFTSLATTQGLIPNKDYFSQYGPLFPFVQGAILRLFGDEVIHLRFFNALLLALITVTLYEIVRTKLSNFHSFLIGLLWITGTSAGWTTLLPWVNVFTTFVFLISVFLYMSIQRNVVSVFRRTTYVLLSGILLGSIPFLRIQTIPVFFASMLIYLVVFRKLSQNLKLIGFGTLLSFAIFSFIFIHNGSFIPYIQQCLIWPLTYYAPQDYSIESLAPNIYFIAVPAFWIISRRLIKRNWVFAIWTTLIFLVSLIYTSSHELSYISLSRPDILLNSMLNAILGSFFYMVIMIAIYLFVRLIWIVFSQKQIDQKTLVGIFPLLLAFSQLYPAWDPAHIWWVFPLIAVSFAMSSSVNFMSGAFSRYLPLILGITIAGFLTSSSYLLQERDYYSVPLLKGMKSEPSVVNMLEDNLTSLVAIKARSMSTKFDCPDAIYAVSDSVVQTSTPSFINWGPELNAGFTNFDYVFVCNQNIGYFDQIYGKDFRIIQILPSLDFPDKFNLIGQKIEK